MTEKPTQELRAHDDQCEATDFVAGGGVDPRLVCHCQDRADVAAAKEAGPVFLDLDDLDDLEDALHASQPTYPRCATCDGGGCRDCM